MGYLFVAIAGVLWGLLGPVTRIAMREGVGAVEVAFWRALLAAGIFAVHAIAIRRVRLERRDVPSVVAFGVVGVAGLLACYSRAVEAGGAALAAILLYTAPVWVALLSALFMGERMTGRKLLALAVATAGVAGIAVSSGDGGIRLTPAALGWGLASGFAYALYYLFGKRYFEKYATATLFVYALPVGAAAMLPLADFTHKTPAAWGALAFIAVVCTYGAYLFYSAGLRRVEATRAATVATVEPVVAAIAAFAMWGERLSATGYACAAVVLLGVLLMVTGNAAKPVEPPHG
jgi:DME family drug/metabolite transporter